MITVSLEDIQRDIIGCLQRVRDGETLIVTDSGQPIAEIKPVAAAQTSSTPTVPEDNLQSFEDAIRLHLATPSISDKT